MAHDLRGKRTEGGHRLLDGIGSLLDAKSPSATAAKLLFRYYDKDGNGTLDPQETLAMLHDYGFGDEKAAILEELMDSDGDRLLSYDEFWAWLNRDEKMELLEDTSRYHMLKHAVGLFHSCDADADGRISPDELASLLRGWGEEDVDGALADVFRFQLDLTEAASPNRGGEGGDGGGGGGPSEKGSDSHVSLQAFLDYISQFDDWKQLASRHKASRSPAQ